LSDCSYQKNNLKIAISFMVVLPNHPSNVIDFDIVISLHKKWLFRREVARTGVSMPELP
jgi:hypothetical protein